jgi:glutathione S-transferase
MTPVLKIYHMEARRSERVVWLCEELGIPYELIFIPGDVVGSWALIKNVHPMGLAPTVKDGATTICESGAIIEYILARYGQGRLSPAVDSAEFPYYLEWMHFAEGTMAGRLMNEKWLQPRPGTVMERAYDLTMVGVTDRMLNWIEAILAEKQYIAGHEFTAADIMMPMVLNLGHIGGAPLTGYSHIHRYLDRLKARPAYVRTLQICQPLGPPPF